MYEAQVPRRRLNIDDYIRCSITRAIASPNYPVFLEESTRRERQLLQSGSDARRRRRERESSSWFSSSVEFEEVFAGSDSNAERYTSKLLFPLDLHQSKLALEDDPGKVSPPKVVLIGGTGYFGKFLGEECRKKKFDLVVVARDVEKAKRIFEPIFDGSMERRRKESMGYILTTDSTPTAVLGPSSSTPYQRRLHSDPPRLSIVQADVSKMDEEDNVTAVRSAMHQSSLVFYMASARSEPFPSRNHIGAVDYEGLKHCAKLCNSADSHFVFFSPLFCWQSQWRPIYLWYNYFSNRRGYLRYSRARERLFLNDNGTSASFYCDECPQMRFSILRVNHLVYPSSQTRTLVAKNNNLVDTASFVDLARVGGKGFLTGGDLCARNVATVILRAFGFHRGLGECRVDFVGTRREVPGAIPMDSMAELDRCLEGMR